MVDSFSENLNLNNSIISELKSKLVLLEIGYFINLTGE